MKVLLTGSAGYIGKNLLNTLIKSDYNVTALIHKKKPDITHSNARYMKGDISDYSFISSLPKDVDIVIHCAAIVRDFGPKSHFMKVNYEATKSLADFYQNTKLKQFIFFSHIPYEKNTFTNYYTKTKELSEKALLDKYHKTQFPVTILRPGNVFGPGATVWVNRIIKSIQNNRIALINGGHGTFFHTYIDNLLDAVYLTLDNSETFGKAINITDGDNNVTWKQYFHDLSTIINENPPQKNLSKNVALIIGYFMMVRYNITKKEPWVTPTAVHSMTSHKKVSIKQAKNLLHYHPKIDYDEALAIIQTWWEKKNRL